MHLSKAIALSISIVFSGTAVLSFAADSLQGPANAAGPADGTAATLAAPALSTAIAPPTAPAPAFDTSLKLNATPDRNMGPNDLALDGLLMEDMDLWNRIRKGFAIPDLDNQLVANQTAWYAARPDYIQRTTTRASRYLYHVVEELEKRGMPTELALLPFIESAFDPQALSSAKASGMWQFMPATGTTFNLKQNMFKDDRRDVISSTDAALTYLQRLHDMFGDWQLALAAYNWGEGSVQRAVNRNKALGLPTDFESLSPRMPAETRNYVPKLQAVKNIIANPGYYSIVLPQLENQPYFVTVDKSHDIDVDVAAKLAELPLDEFRALNPQFNRPVITSDTPILLPETNADKFRENLANWGHALSNWTSHTITTAREKIESIAEQFGTTPDVLREVNHIPPHTHLAVGSTILVPRTEATANVDIAPEVAENARMQIESDAPAYRRVFIRASRRDTLSSIAARNHVSVAQLKSWNDLRADRIAAGQRIEVQVPVRATGGLRRIAAHAPARSTHHVAAASHRGHIVAAAKGKKRHA
ncbi:MAG TPA: transglycosylase SLT domain-containing protein [Burkholderiaceae bacterium]